MIAVSLSLKASLFGVAALCMFQTAEAQCTSTENTTVNACVTAFIATNQATIIKLATSDACDEEINCGSLDTATKCANVLPLTNGCKQTLEGMLNGQLSTTKCKLADLYTKCPDAEKLDTGSSSGRPGGVLISIIVAMTVISLLKSCLTN